MKITVPDQDLTAVPGIIRVSTNSAGMPKTPTASSGHQDHVTEIVERGLENALMSPSHSPAIAGLEVSRRLKGMAQSGRLPGFLGAGDVPQSHNDLMAAALHAAPWFLNPRSGREPEPCFPTRRPLIRAAFTKTPAFSGRTRGFELVALLGHHQFAGSGSNEEISKRVPTERRLLLGPDTLPQERRGPAD